MNAPQQSSVPLEYAAEVAFELHLMRSECSSAAQYLLQKPQWDELALEECALLDEALDRAQNILHTTIQRIRRARTLRQPKPE